MKRHLTPLLLALLLAGCNVADSQPEIITVQGLTTSAASDSFVMLSPELIEGDSIRGGQSIMDIKADVVPATGEIIRCRVEWLNDHYYLLEVLTLPESVH